jgi:hypothetical protein
MREKSLLTLLRIPHMKRKVLKRHCPYVWEWASRRRLQQAFKSRAQRAATDQGEK